MATDRVSRSERLDAPFHPDTNGTRWVERRPPLDTYEDLEVLLCARGLHSSELLMDHQDLEPV